MSAAGRLMAVLLLSAPAIGAAHQGHSNKAPWTACAEGAVNDACAWEDGHHARYVGTCRSVRDTLVCVRNQPIVQPGEAEVRSAITRLTGGLITP